MAPKKNALIISFSDLSKDPRVFRQIKALGHSYNIFTAGNAPPNKTWGVAGHFNLQSQTSSKLKKTFIFVAIQLKQYNWAYWKMGRIKHAIQILSNRTDFDLIIANDIDTLPIALIIKGNAKVILDAHEYAPEEHAHSTAWRLTFKKFYEFLCKTYLPRADKVYSVAPNISQKYSQNFNVPVDNVFNCPFYEDLSARPVNPERIRIIHHGGAIPTRKLELMIQAMALTNQNISLDFMLVPTDPNYLETLKTLAKGNSRIRFVDPVKMENIAKFVNNYDIGLYLLKPNNFNELNALPNKFFEFIQGRVAIVIGPSPEMSSIVKQYKIGRVAGDFTPEALAKEINSITTEEILSFKNNTDIAAKEFSFEKQVRKYIL